MAFKNNLLDRMAGGEFLISIQIDPPGTNKTAEFKNVVDQLIASGVELVDINSSRRISHDSIQLATALARCGLDVIPHVTTRDSSINGLINQVFAAYAWGPVRNFLMIAGDPYEASQAMAPSHGVFQTDAVGALRAFDTHLRKNDKLLLDITLAAATNQNESDLTREGKRIQEKQSAGADFFMSQPVFSKNQALHLFDFYQTHSRKPLLVGIWPLINPKTARAIREGRIVGVVLPDEIYQEAHGREDETEFERWGIEKAYALIEWIRKSKKAQGVYIVAPLRNPLLLNDLFQKIF